MARVIIQDEVFDDFDRIVDHLVRYSEQDAVARIQEITDALRILETSPQIGRRAASGLRELVIGTGSRGYVALYEFVPDLDVVYVVAIRAQREAGYKHS
jgi:toxin ParE1/3/4